MRPWHHKNSFHILFIHGARQLAAMLFIVCMLLSMSSCSVFNYIRSETEEPKEYALSYMELQLSDQAYGVSYVNQISMTSENSGWLLTTEHELYHTDNGIPAFQKVNEIPVSTLARDTAPYGCFLNDTCAYLAYFSEHSIVIESTTSSGNVWTQTHIPYTEYGDAGSLFLSFADTEHGYLLYCSTPAAGHMSKFLFQTQDGGHKFELVSDLTNIISGYPTGITLSFPDQNGSPLVLISITSRENSAYLFQSVDGGITWESLTLQPYTEAAQFYRINAYCPIFLGDTRTRGVLLLQYISEDPCYAIYQTTDAGLTWTPEGIFYGDSIQTYSFWNETEGFFVDYTGTLFSLSSKDTSH